MRLSARLLALAAASCMVVPVIAQSPSTVPISWVDKDTGHRVFRLTDEAGSSGFYFNVNAYSPDGKLMAYSAPGINEPDFWQPGVFHSEHLVNMAHHNYRLEPNVRFSPDKKLVIFTSNMFGPSYVFGVEVDKAANPSASEVHSTPELAKQFNPVDPTPTPDDK